LLDYLGASAGCMMAGIPTAAESDTQRNILGVNHLSSSDHEGEYSEVVAEEDDDDNNDDVTPTTNNDNHKKISKRIMNKSSKTTTNPVPLLVTFEEAYEQSGNSKAVLLSMGIGIKDLSVDMNEEPYKSSKNSRKSNVGRFR
jgi:hypothetical protein